MLDKYTIVTYGELSEFLDEQSKTIRQSNYSYKELLPQIIQSFKSLSKMSEEEHYARLFSEATNS